MTLMIPSQLDLIDGWQAAQTATLAAALIAVIGVVATILTTAARARREHKTDLYAEALGAVADYLEGPYRIRRKDGTAAHRNAITAALSDVKSAIDHSQELLRLRALPGVANAYDAYVHAAKIEAGQQMHDAWVMPAITSDAGVNLEVGYERILAARYRTQVVQLMQADIGRTSWNPVPLARYAWRIHHLLEAPATPAATKSSARQDQEAASSAAVEARGDDTPDEYQEGT